MHGMQDRLPSIMQLQGQMLCISQHIRLVVVPVLVQRTWEKPATGVHVPLCYEGSLLDTVCMHPADSQLPTLLALDCTVPRCLSNLFHGRRLTVLLTLEPSL